MKIKWLLFLILLMFISSVGYSQCSKDKLLSSCMNKLGNYTFVKSYKVETNEENPYLEFKTYLNKDNKYMIAVASSTKNKKVVVNLYDSNYELISSSYYKPKELYVDRIVFKCTSSGVYYIEAFLQGNAPGCGITLVGFQKM